MTRPPDANLPPQSAQWGRSVEDRLSALVLSASLNTQDVNNTLLQLNSSVQLLSQQVANLNNRAIVALGDSSTLNVTVPTGDQTTISWNANTSPQVTVNTPYSQVLVTIGCFATANGLSTSDFVYAFMGLSVGGATPNTGFGDWPSVNSQNPVSGSSFSANLTLTRLIAVTPDVDTTFNPRYGYGRQGGVVGTTSCVFSGRYVSITPIPD